VQGRLDNSRKALLKQKKTLILGLGKQEEGGSANGNIKIAST